MKEFGLSMADIETPFTMHGNMSDAKATQQG